MTKTCIKRVIISALLCLVLSLGMFTPFSLPVSAAESNVSVKSYEETSIEDDLAELDLNIYPFNPLGECEVISFMEYCYSERSDVSGYYGLYVYVYNPTKEPIYDSELNKLNIKVGNGEFEKISLKYLNKTSDNLFYKFKLEEQEELLNLAKSYASENGSIRRYELTELEIKYSGETVKSFDISKVYEYFGYAAYCDSERTNVSTLSCKDYGARSIHLNIQQTNYRFAENELLETRDELNSVYFSIPEEYFREFGNLNNISAEWYEYKTAPMFVTSDKDAYIALWDMRNILVNDKAQKLLPLGPNYGYGPTLIPSGETLTYWRVFWSGYKTMDTNLNPITFMKSYNPFCRQDINDDGSLDEGAIDYYDVEPTGYLNRLSWLFYSPNVLGKNDYCISKQEVVDYAKLYTNSFYLEEKIQDKYAKNLFAESIDSDRIQFLKEAQNGATSGLVQMNFTADAFDGNKGNVFVDTDKTQSAWNKFWYGEKYESVTYSPIVVISEADLILDKEAFSQKYYVNINDVDNVIDTAKKSYEANERPVLLRFAVTDYYASTARFDFAEEGEFNSYEMSSEDGYVAQETVFFDFDVISLGFMSAGGYTETLVGVVADPIDIINGLTPPDELVENQEWWQKIMMALGIIILVVVLTFLGGPISFVLRIVYDGIKVIIKALLWLISRPFKIIGWIFRR